VDGTELTVQTDVVDLGDGQVRGRVALRGEVDAHSSAKLTAAVDQLLEAGATAVLLDATEVSFIDSSGLRVLAVASNSLAERGGTFVIDGMSAAMQRILEVTGLLEKYRS
jgi:anti-anti-sigma factor